MRTKRCHNCDLDGEVVNTDPNRTRAYMKCPVCDGTRQIEKEPFVMNEEALYRWLMISTACLAVLCGLGSVALVILSAISFSIGVLVCALLLAGGAIGCGYITMMFADKTNVPKVFNNQDEKEVLTNKQRKTLKEARAEVVMEKAMIEVEHERQNIVHNLELEAADPDKPPHPTRWSPDQVIRQLRSPTDPR